MYPLYLGFKGFPFIPCHFVLDFQEHDPDIFHFYFAFLSDNGAIICRVIF
jgi:hypothetical protein